MQKFRTLDDKRLGLLFRMSLFRSCVTSKKIIQPLLTRGFAEHNGISAYHLTPRGKRAARKLMRENEGRKIETYRGLAIGPVLIVDDKRISV